jgi:hypothetical protein
MQTEPDDEIRYSLRLDRDTFQDLREISEEQRCSVGGVCRFFIKNAIASWKARSKRNSH